MLNTIQYNLFNNWNLIRTIRLVISVFIIAQSIELHNVIFGFLGCFFLFQALTNTGCCANNSCAPNINKSDDKEEIDFSEIKNK